jgi:hypothetical protein
MAQKKSLLDAASFGERIAEDEVQDLAQYFVETDQWRRLISGEADIVYGPKGAGKSALYALLIQKADELFDRGIVLITAENPSGTPAFKDVAVDPPTGEEEFIALWKAYFLSLVAGVLREWSVETPDALKVYEYLEGAGLVAQKASLQSTLKAARDYVRQFAPKEIEAGVMVDPTTGTPIGFTGRISLREPNQQMRSEGFISLDELLGLANGALHDLDLSAWLLLDRLDVAFVQHEDLEKNALRALFKAYLDIKHLEQISLKIFLRTDIWNRITEEGFREASHITASITITWDPQSLLQLTMRRVLRNAEVASYYDVEPETVFSSVDEQEALLKRMVPDQVDAGRNPKTFDWMLSRTKDGSGQTAPRELIHLLSSLRDGQLRRIEVGHDEPADEMLFDRIAFKDALREVSEVRLKQTLFAEYPELKQYLEALQGAKAQQSPQTLGNTWGVDESEAREIADRLVDIGFFERRGTLGAPDYWVPFLYRDALQLVQGEARLDQ